ncbi:MAG: class I SAM-dependent methyltransferase [Pseudomonadota bacterium]
MTTTEELQAQQTQFWNGEMGDIWVKEQAFIDGMLHPFEEVLVNHAQTLAPQNLLDIGCGNGTTTRAHAEALPDTRCTGIDLSETMVANARAITEHANTNFIATDAAIHDFGDAEFDLLTSRFGVMFFPDPVAAFSNFRRSASPEAHLALLVWRSPEDNEFMTTGQKAAAPYLPETPPPPENAPSPFSFGDPDRVSRIMQGSSFGKIDFHPVDLELNFPVADLDMFLTKIAPIGHDLSSLEDDVRTQIMRSVRAAYEKFIDGDEVRYTASTWLITGRAA